MKPEDIYEEVGRNIRRYRDGARRTQEQVAAAIGMSRASLANIEVGRQKVRLHHLYAIAEALDLASPALLLPLAASAPYDAALPLAAEAAGHYGTSAPPELPLPKEGLTDKQRLEVLRLLSDVLSSPQAGNTGDEG